MDGSCSSVDPDPGEKKEVSAVCDIFVIDDGTVGANRVNLCSFSQGNMSFCLDVSPPHIGPHGHGRDWAIQAVDSLLTYY